MKFRISVSSKKSDQYLIMNKAKKISFLLLLFAINMHAFAQHQSKVFISDSEYLKKVDAAFSKQKIMAVSRADALFDVFNDILTIRELQALKFLIAYLPLSDLADLDGDYLLKHVRYSLMAQDTFAWSKEITEDVFRHFVLPFRVNNETPDTARMVFFYELKDRVKNLGMADAALEVNHWCHEKVVYLSTDMRTSAPLATVQTAYGRCGEESVFTVSALRAVGIPARQVYTPRWAHCDDNHAWVEVWVDGKWHFMGACEPEPGLDMAWFAGPVLRAMLCNTTVYGDYSGIEEVIGKEEKFTRINLIENYAPSGKVYVKVSDSKGNPVNKARVEFQLYNYAEFYPLAVKETDTNGLASLFTGFGDILIWVSNQGLYDYKKVTVENADTVYLIPEKSPPATGILILDLIPPIERKPATPDSNGKKMNEARLHQEDMIRAKYEYGFPDSLYAVNFAGEYKYNADSIWQYIKKSRGNHVQTELFLKNGKNNKKHVYAILNHISDKDFRDTPAAVLEDHLFYSDKTYCIQKGISDEIFEKYVLSPRISYEILTPYKKYLREHAVIDFNKEAISDPVAVFNYVNEHIIIEKTANYSRTPLSPAGVFELKHSDTHSRDIFFTALCRSLGIPAMIDPATSVVKYHNGVGWQEVFFEKKLVENSPKGALFLSYLSADTSFRPQYYTHFTLARYNAGVFRSLDFEYSSAFDNFPAEISLDTGHYMIVSGVRKNDGSVLAQLHYFTIQQNITTNFTMGFRDAPETPVIFGKIANNAGFLPDGQDSLVYFNELIKEQGAIIAWISPEHEPTRHTLTDITHLKENFEKWGGTMVFLYSDEKKRLSEKEMKLLPAGIISGMDIENVLAKINPGGSSEIEFPVFIALNKKGEIIYFSTGYQIGRGEQMIKLFRFM